MSKSKSDVPKRADGQIRQSQMISMYGPGAMVDLVDRAVVIGGLEHWSYGSEGYRRLDEPRLRRSLVPRLKALDPNLDLAAEGYFRLAPACDARDPSPKVGVRALEFPRWFVCQGCRRLARAADAFETKNNRYRHQCERNRWAHAVPVRFVAACRRGHLTDFPWIPFAHEEKACDRPELYLREGATGDVARIIVECRNCGSSRPLSQATVLPFPCNGDRPWLGGKATNETCDQQLKLMVRTASDAYFAQVVTALRLPEPDPDPLLLKLREKDVWDILQHVTSLDQLRTFAVIPRIASAIEGVSLDKVLATVEAERSAERGKVERPLRTAEYERLTHAPEEVLGVLAPQGVEFAAFEIPDARADLPRGVSRLVVVPELREVRVQISFSRFAALSADLQGEYDFSRARVRPAVLTLPTGNEKWLPAAEVRGEGIFFELDLDAVLAWEEHDAVRERADALLRAFQADGQGGEFPGIRFYLLHSLSHLLLTAISLECGYAASSIRERIYCEAALSNDRKGMAGVLLSTGTTGAEGTLGGLVEEGRRLRHHLREAWELGRLCSNDPVCAAHNPVAEGSDRRLEGAACHGCLYVAESSCERFNRFLDRALVVPTIGNDPALAFFRERP
ncbi:DUF1998 domain-containing protein [Nannocystis pusilla]|uniref:DUF1998 domain-containing protein n=1 Tax=Nannocystis pusilla TaxID=889268 RepID=A0ABS7TME5_9BACT|nr:DUF1998 domain-containing protein [Nannocystis pusilla]MBZ5709394.1 DUF1998 domain-containing protein [Nannocystis pusilla]